MCVRVKVPQNLAGASLLGVHNWIKSEMTRTNPGGSPDYSLSDTSGNKITLSDVARSAGKEVNIEVTAVSGVRRNPASAIHTIPELEMDYPTIPRTGNDITMLLPNDVDPAMATRIIAEQGLRRGLHTLNRLSLTAADRRITSPTAAALLQMGEAIRTNPGKTPFTQQTPINYSSERGLAEFLKTHAKGVEGIDVADEEQIYGAVADAKVAARYGLNKTDIEKFARDVLSDYLIAASANRGLIRAFVRNLPDLKGDRDTINKLLAMFPQQPRAFYEGTQRVFVAHPAFMYPTYSESILSTKEMERIVSFARGYPGNMGRTDRVPKSLTSLVMTGYSGGLYGYLRAFLTGVEAGDSAPEFDQAFDRTGHLKMVMNMLTQDPRLALRRRDFRPLRYFTDLGGMYPTPPPKWPPGIVYAVMDAFLQNLPHIINMQDPNKSNLTPVRMAYISKAKDAVEIGGKEVKLTTLDAINKLLVSAVNEDDKDELVNKMTEINKKLSDANISEMRKDLEVPELKGQITSAQEAISNYVSMDGSDLTTEGMLTFDRSKGKSILEFAYDVAELANTKYNYNMRGDDFKFTMALIYYSFEAMKNRTTGTAFDLTRERYDNVLQDFLGESSAAELDKLREQVGKSDLGDDERAFMAQGLFLARLMRVRDQMDSMMSQRMSQDEMINMRAQLRERYDRIVQSVRTSGVAGSTRLAADQILGDMLRAINGGVMTGA